MIIFAQNKAICWAYNIESVLAAGGCPQTPAFINSTLLLFKKLWLHPVKPLYMANIRNGKSVYLPYQHLHGDNKLNLKIYNLYKEVVLFGSGLRNAIMQFRD